MRTPEAFDLMPKHESNILDYQPLFAILSPVHRLHHSLRIIEASGGDGNYSGDHAEKKMDSETAIVADNTLSKKISPVFLPQSPLLEAEKITGLVKERVQNKTDENEMDIQYLSSTAPCENERLPTVSPQLKTSASKVLRPGRRGGLKCTRCRRHKRGTKAPCEILPEDPDGPCLPCRKNGHAETCSGRSYPIRKTVESRSSGALARLAAVAAWASANPSSLSFTDRSDFQDETPQINRDISNRKPEASPSQEEHKPSPSESTTTPDVGFREAAIEKNSVPSNQSRRPLASSGSQAAVDLEDHDVAWLPNNLAKFLSAYVPSADRAIIDSIVLVATHMLQKHRDQKSTVPIQHSFFSPANAPHNLTEQYNGVIVSDSFLDISIQEAASDHPDIINVSQTVK